MKIYKFAILISLFFIAEISDAQVAVLAKSDQIISLQDLKKKLAESDANWIPAEGAVESRETGNIPEIFKDTIEPLPPCADGVPCLPGITPQSKLLLLSTSVKDQGNCGTCTTFASIGALESVYLKQTGIAKDLSEQFVASCSSIYTSCRAGAAISSVFDSLAIKGTYAESILPYTASISECPVIEGNSSLVKAVGKKYYAVRSANDLKAILWDLQVPVVAGFKVYDDFFYYSGGVYKNVAGTSRGGHAILVVGYDDSTQSFIVKNSWGLNWGEQGYFRISYDEVSATSRTQFAVSFGGVAAFSSADTQAVPVATSLVSPGGTTGSSGAPNYIWTAIANATHYTLKVDGEIVKSLTAVEANCGKGAGRCEVLGSTLSANERHFWSVQTRNAYGFGADSRALDFTIGSHENFILNEGLIWKPIDKQNYPLAAKTWVEANTFCSTTTFDNRKNWRLPTQAELVSLYGSRLVINQGWTLGYMWSSTPSTEGKHKVFDLGNGTTSAKSDSEVNNFTCIFETSAANKVMQSLWSRFLLGDEEIFSVPGSPTIIAVVAGNAQATISFTEPSNNGGSAITGYTATCSATGQTTRTATGASSPITVTSLTADVAYSCSVTATNSTGISTASDTLPVTPIPTVSNSARLINLSTRGQVQTGDNIMIGGFVIGGSVAKSVLIRAVGPNLANYGVTGVLANPTLKLLSGQTQIASNDDWGSAANAAAIQATGKAPVSPLESAILTTLSPGIYTAQVSGVSGGTGVGIVEVFEMDQADSPLINISTRGQVQTGDNVMIGGFVIGGSAAQTVLIRAVGPNLANYGVTGVLANPMLQLYAGQTLIASNDDWGSAANAAAIQATGKAPVSPLESAILVTLSPGIYTAKVSGVGGGTGVGIIEVFAQ